MSGGVRFARYVFGAAGIYGLLCALGMYLNPAVLGTMQPVPLVFFYGFAGVVLAWQIAFLIIASDPLRYRLLMLAALVEKITFVIAVAILQNQGPLPLELIVGAAIDGLLFVLFALSYFLTRRA